MLIHQDHFVSWLRTCKKRLEESKDILTEMDRVIGDADHGLNMCRGFNKVEEQLLQETLQDDIGALFKITGMSLLSSVGGASGPLYGTLFLKAAPQLDNKTAITLEELYTAFKAGVEGMAARGKAAPGDKTLCDVWWPVLSSLESSCKQHLDTPNAIQQACSTAKTAAQSTTIMRARKGRASYLGERSVGYQDPGATSSLIILEALQEAISFKYNQR